MGRIAELRARAQRRTRNVYDTLFTRRVSIYVTAVLYPLGVSANAVSTFSLFVVIAACALIGLGTGWQLYAGIACVHLFAVLDSVDGELARLRETYTIKGLFLEDLCAFTMINGMFLALGGYLLRTQAIVWPLVLGVIVVAFGRNAMQVARRAVVAWIGTGRPAARRVAKSTDGLRTMVENTLLHFTNMWIITTSLILVEELAGVHDRRLVLYAYCFFAVAVLVKELAAIVTFAVTRELEHGVAELRDQAASEELS